MTLSNQRKACRNHGSVVYLESCRELSINIQAATLGASRFEVLQTDDGMEKGGPAFEEQVKIGSVAGPAIYMPVCMYALVQLLHISVLGLRSW